MKGVVDDRPVESGFVIEHSIECVIIFVIKLVGDIIWVVEAAIVDLNNDWIVSHSYWWFGKVMVTMLRVISVAEIKSIIKGRIFKY